MIKIQVILGTTRPNRFSEIVGHWVFEEISKTKGMEAELIDLRDWPLPFYNETGSPIALEGKFENEIATKWNEKIAEADGFIIVSPEYNHGYPAVLKNALDYAYFPWNNKPVGFVAYGGVVGGARAVEQLREVVVELQMIPIREAVYFAGGRRIFDETGKPKDETVADRLVKMLDQLLWWADVLKKARKTL